MCALLGGINRYGGSTSLEELFHKGLLLLLMVDLYVLSKNINVTRSTSIYMGTFKEFKFNKDSTKCYAVANITFSV